MSITKTRLEVRKLTARLGARTAPRGDREMGNSTRWPAGVTFVLNPPQASTLRSIVIPPYGGETLIASSAGAYLDLPAPLRAFADTLQAVHTNDYDYSVPPESLDEKKRERRGVVLS